ncbi:MAG: carbamoyltransferase [Chlamydiae bacterium]|nr:carbamoyltransferase [Chlamydiota bacterium]MBI3267306.1 carbamoyltransferase [Chlamydiota bacterium]
MVILGINAYHADASASILLDGRLIAAVEEERFRRVKHWAGFPREAIQFCLHRANISLNDVDHIAISRDPKAHFWKKVFFTLLHQPKVSYLKDRLQNRSRVRDVLKILSQELNVPVDSVKAGIHHVEHHRSHMGSAFFVSPFEEAAVVSIDALGDYVSTMWALGRGNKLQVFGSVEFPNSLGFFYTAGTQFLGFPHYGDEYKVMGLASYGRPTYIGRLREMVQWKNGTLKLDLSYFRHHNEGVPMTWDGGEPVIGTMYSKKWEEVLGPACQKGEPLTSRHEDIAASLQAIFEEIYFEVFNYVHKMTGLKKLCLAGGCAMNSVANGKIFDRTPFEEVYIQPAAGDSGTAIGAAFYVHHQILDYPRQFVMNHSYWGPEFSEAKLNEELKVKNEELKKNGCEVRKIEDENSLCLLTAQAIADGKVIGWFQGPMEWGARALGNRSILADPRRPEMKDILNARIKRREPFRPFAPSILLEKVGEYFEKDYPDPFMLKVYPVRSDKRALIPSVTHVDGTGRLQTVRREDNPLYWKLIKTFEELTGIPILLNTSFNENEPIVCQPKEALDCLLRTKMDVLVMGKYMISRV